MRSASKSMVATALGLALAATACIPSFHQPDIRLDGVRLGGLGLRGGTLYALLSIANPNGYALETTGLSYDLELNDPGATADDGWIRIAQGTFDDTLRVSGKDSTVVEVPIDFSYQGAGAAMRSIMDRGTFDYRITGIVNVRDPIRRSVPYRRIGKISMAGIR
jgi:LEA14-like dessication related protein